MSQDFFFIGKQFLYLTIVIYYFPQRRKYTVNLSHDIIVEGSNLCSLLSKKSVESWYEWKASKDLQHLIFLLDRTLSWYVVSNHFLHVDRILDHWA